MLSKFRKKMGRLLEAAATPLVKLGIGPNAVSVAGFLASLWFLWLSFAELEGAERGLLVLALAISGLMDSLDGVVAKMRGLESKMGAFVDSILDRASDSVYMFSLYKLGLLTAEEMALLLAGSLLVSYARARAEGLGLECSSIGFAERAERILMILAMVFLYAIGLSEFVWPIKVFLIAAVYATLVQRVGYALRKLPHPSRRAESSR